MNNLMDNTNKCTDIKTCTFTYNPLILYMFGSPSDHPQGIYLKQAYE